MNIIDHHKTEAANLALEHFDIIRRKEQIESRMRELTVIIKTAEHAENDKRQAMDELREKLGGEKEG